MKKELSASEALYGFCGWLTTRKEVTRMSSKTSGGITADLVEKFCKANNLSEPRKNWSKRLTHPVDSGSGYTVNGNISIGSVR